jgi:hypothetical protein
MGIWKNSTDGTLHDDMSGTALSLPNWPVGLTLLTDEQVAAARAPTTAQLHAVLVAQAQAALAVSDNVAIRCAKKGVSFSTWLSYDAALVAIVNGSDTTSTSLPTMPAYPVGS